MARALTDWIAELIDELALPLPPPSTESRHYRLVLNEQIEVEVVELENSCLLKGVIGKPPEQNREAFFLRAMEANLFGAGTRGAVIGLDEEEKLLTLSRQLDYNGAYREFKEKLEDFTSVLDFWRQEALAH